MGQRIAVNAGHLHVGIVHVYRCLLPCLHIDIAALEDGTLTPVRELEDCGQDLCFDIYQIGNLLVNGAFNLNQPVIFVRVFGGLRPVCVIVLRDTK